MVNNNARVLLRRWISTAGLNYAALADILKISVPHLSRLITGGRMPSLELAMRIEKLTGIPAESWITTQAVEGVEGTHV